MPDIFEALRNFGATTETERPPNGHFWRYLKKLSQEGHPSGESVELSNQGQTTIFSTPSFEKPRSKESTTAAWTTRTGEAQAPTTEEPKEEI